MLVAYYILFMPMGCDDVGGVPSWERCTSMAGLPAFSLKDFQLNAAWDILLPLAAGFFAAGLVWFLTGLASQEPNDDSLTSKSM